MTLPSTVYRSCNSNLGADAYECPVTDDFRYLGTDVWACPVTGDFRCMSGWVQTCDFGYLGADVWVCYWLWTSFGALQLYYIMVLCLAAFGVCLGNVMG